MWSFTVAQCLALLSVSGMAITANAQTYAPPYGQCGGRGYGGPILCGSGYQCTAVNSYYSQCVPIPRPCYGYCPPTSTTTIITRTSTTPTPTPTGYDPVVGAPGRCAIRRRVDVLQRQFPNEFNMLILAMEAVMADPEAADLSWFGIGGIHSAPFKPWQGPATGRRTGYCFHMSPVFGTWHRPYVLLLEQTLVRRAIAIANTFPTTTRATYVNAANQLRWPYWDWAESSQRAFPAIVMQPTVSVIRPTSGGAPVTINNPFYRYRFQNMAWLPSQDFTGSYTLWQTTLRWPSSPSGSAVSQDSLGSTAMSNTWQFNRRPATYNALVGNSAFNAFSNAIELVHNDVHVQSGGGGGGIPQGHVGTVAYAGMDPLFWLHHCNVDRLVAMWQAIWPGVYQTPSAGTNTYANIVSGGFPQDSLTTPLTPFRRADGSWWQGNDVRDASSIWRYNYGYEEVPCNYTGNLRDYTLPFINRLYGPVRPPPIREDWGVSCNLDIAELAGPWTINYFVGPTQAYQTKPAEWLRDPYFVGTVSAFNQGRMEQSKAYSTKFVLTDALIARKVDLSYDNVVRYLSENLSYTIRSGDDYDVAVPITNLRTLRCAVYVQPVTYGPVQPVDDYYMPVYTPPKYVPEVSYKLPAGIRDPKEMTYVTLLDNTTVEIVDTYTPPRYPTPQPGVVSSASPSPAVSTASPTRATVAA